MQSSLSSPPASSPNRSVGKYWRQCLLSNKLKLRWRSGDILEEEEMFSNNMRTNLSPHKLPGMLYSRSPLPTEQCTTEIPLAVSAKASMEFYNSILIHSRRYLPFARVCRILFHTFYFVGFVGTWYDHQSYKLGGDFVSSQEKWPPPNFIFSTRKSSMWEFWRSEFRNKEIPASSNSLRYSQLKPVWTALFNS